MKKLLSTMMLMPLMALAGEVAVMGVTAQQRHPWNGLVDVTVIIKGAAKDVAGYECVFVATNSATKAAILVGHITQNGDDMGSGNDWTRKFIWDAKADVGAVKIDDVVLTVTLKPIGCVQLWENGPYWAECNAGASRPEECGYYFWWGDTVGYKRNSANNGWVSVKDGSSFSFSSGNCPTYGKDISPLQSMGYIDSTGNLVAKYDAATVYFGVPWRMPTHAEFSALINNCTTIWTTRNGVSGRLFTGKGAYSSKSIFFPAAGEGRGSDIYDYDIYGLGIGHGYYWSSMPASGNINGARGLEFYFDDFYLGYYNSRFMGRPVRPVRGFAETERLLTGTGATTHFALVPPVVEVSGVEAQQRYPWNGLVDITVTIQGVAEDVASVECVFLVTNGAVKAAIPAEHITRNGDDMGSGNVWMRKFIWDAKDDVGEVKIDDVALTVVLKPMGVQLWENGPYWAEYNVGATKPEETGYYFWWGDTVGYKRNASNTGWISVKDSIVFAFNNGNYLTYGKSISQLQLDGYIDTTGNLVAAHDAATVHLGAPWRIPTDAEFDALIYNCTTTWTTRNGVPGRLVTGKGAYSSKSIFFPAGGRGYWSYLDYFGSYAFYWSATPHSGDVYEAWSLDFSDVLISLSHNDRDYGRSVRPIRGFADASANISDNATTAHLSLDTRAGSRDLSTEGANIRYDASWYESGISANVKDNGTVIASGVSGDFTWLPADDGAHTLKLSVFDSAGSLVGLELAEFVVAGRQSITYANLHGVTHANPATYQEGTAVSFTPPSGRTGYTFTGWTPAAITAEMTGAQTVTAGWRANAYQVVYSANGGSGTMTAADCEYDKESEIAANGFTRSGYVFKGWATVENGEVVYQPGDKVMNLTSNDSGVVKLYAVWEAENVETPVIEPADGSVFETVSCAVTITCATEGAAIYYTTDGTTPRAKPAFLYTGPFEITDTATIVAMAVKNGIQGDYAEATIKHVEPEPLTLASALGEPKLYCVGTGGDVEWAPVVDETAEVGTSSAVSGALDEDDEGMKQVSWLEAKVYGRGTLAFWWRVNCDPDPRKKFTYDYAAFEADDEVVARRDGVTEEWEQVIKTFDTDGEHIIRWRYNADGYLPIVGEYEGCVWVNGVTWSGAEPPASVVPAIEGDEGATVTGDAETGFVVKPSEGKVVVEVTIPQGVDAAKVTVEVSVKVASVKPNGAKVKIVSGAADITEFLNVPTADGSGVVDLTKATVKEEIVKEAMDPAKGAVIDLSGGSPGTASPTITTAPTRVGLFYQLREGETLDGMVDGDSTIGNGLPWTPEIKVKGGNSAFYSIGVGKGK